MLESNLMKDARRLLLLELIALTAILLVAAALRLYRLLDVPPGFHFDEAIDLKIALDVLHGARLIYTPEGWGREALYYYPAALMLRLVAYNPLALRATAALFGLALIGVSYALARRLHGLSLIHISPAPLLSPQIAARTFSATNKLYASRIRRMIGPGRPSPTGCPATLTTGNNARDEPLSAASSSVAISSAPTASSRTSMPNSGMSRSNISRVMPSSTPSPAV